jgi:hypothetical protein
MTLLAELEEFINTHRPHGSQTAHAPETAWNEYLLVVAWRVRFGVLFERWVTPMKTELDLLRLARLN